MKIIPVSYNHYESDDNKRINVRLFLQNLYNLPSVSVDSASSLREILNKVIVNVRALENLDYQRGKLSNELLVQLIVSKLDSKTRTGVTTFYQF